MRKPLVAAIAFILSAVLGVILLLLVRIAIGFVQIAIQQHKHPGIGAIAGGISEASVTTTPILCGILGMFLSLRYLNRKKS
jgi:hypothetical protein